MQTDMSTKKLTPEQVQTVQLLNTELFKLLKPAEMHQTLDSLFTYIYLSDDFDATERLQFLMMYKGFKRFVNVIKTGEITNEPLKIKL